MAGIELQSGGVTLNEGAATRIDPAVSGSVSSETHIYFDACEESKAVTLTATEAEQTGRILDVAMTLKDVCPAKRTAVGIAVSEVDAEGNEYPRGFRAVTVPAHNYAACRDIAMPTVRFILPESLRVDGGTSVCCGSRHFVLRTAMHSIDTEITM